MKLLEFFKVNSFKELDEYIKNNPSDPKVVDLLKVLEVMKDNEKQTS